MAFKGLKRGKAAHQAVAKEDARIEAARAAGSGPRRYWLPRDAEGLISFLDGELDQDTGMLDALCYHEHQARINGRWTNWFACIEDDEPCPLCQDMDGGSKTVNRSLVSPFTVIDHNKWTDKEGNDRQHEKRWFVCKRDTFKRLAKVAARRGGLAGVTFEVSRIGDKSPSVGSDFDYVEKNSLKKLAKKYGLKKKDIAPIDHEAQINYLSADELRKLGFGQGSAPVGSEDTEAVKGKSKSKSKKPDYRADI